VNLGRASDNDHVIEHGSVSRYHARLQQVGPGWLIIDLNSSNGTYVNGVAVSGPHLLRAGDAVRIGELTLTFWAARATASFQSASGDRAETLVRRLVPPPAGGAGADGARPRGSEP